MAGGRKAEELLGVVGTDESTSPLALDYVFSERPQRFACFTLSCSWYYFNSSQSCSTKPTQAWNGQTNACGRFSVWDYCFHRGSNSIRVILFWLGLSCVFLDIYRRFWVKLEAGGNHELLDCLTFISTEVWTLPFQSWPRSQAVCHASHWSLGNACRGHFEGCTHLRLSHNSLLACEEQFELSVHKKIKYVSTANMNATKWEKHNFKQGFSDHSISGKNVQWLTVSV